MSGSDVLWLVVLFLALQPMLRQRLLVATRRRLIRQLERRRGSRVIALVHRQELMSLLGFPLARFINIEDSEEVLRAVQLTDADVPIDLILHTPGGLVLATEQIAHALVAHRAPVTVFVPHYAMSGGTLLALAADEIVMAPHAVLGPLDPQVGQLPAASVMKVVSRKEPKDIDDQTFILADVAEKALAQVHACVVRVLTGNGWDAERATSAARSASQPFPVSTRTTQAWTCASAFSATSARMNVWSSMSFGSLRLTTFMTEAAGSCPTWGSSGPRTAWGAITISSAARARSVPPDIA